MRFIPFILSLFLASTSYAQKTNQQERTVVRIDTIVTFIPNFIEEIVEIVVVYAGDGQEEEKAYFKYETARKIGEDTIIVFDPKTMKEDTIIVKCVLKE